MQRKQHQIYEFVLKASDSEPLARALDSESGGRGSSPNRAVFCRGNLAIDSDSIQVWRERMLKEQNKLKALDIENLPRSLPRPNSLQTLFAPVEHLQALRSFGHVVSVNGSLQ